MDISVIVPVYGVEKYIDKSLRSLFSQTKTEGVEFILVNDCTKDRSIEIAREVIKDFPHCTIRLIEHEVNRGVAAARQTGLDAAIGEYTIHFDPDDWCEPEMLEELYAKAKEDDADIVGCDYIESYPQKEVYVKQIFPDNGIDCTHKFLQGEIGGGLWNKLIRQKLFRDNDIRLDMGVNHGEDLLFCSRVFPYAKKVSYQKKAYLHYVQHQESLTKSSHLSQNAKLEMLKIVESLEVFYTKHNFIQVLRHSLIYRKANAKIYLLQGEKSYRYINLFPEINKHINDLVHIKKHWRFALWSTKSGSLLCFKLINYMTILKSKLCSKTFLY